MKLWQRLYDFLNESKKLCWISLACLVCLLGASSFRLHLQEDIADFLPMSQRQQDNMDIYRCLNNSQRIVVMFSMKDSSDNNPDRLCDAIDAFVDMADFEVFSEMDVNQYFSSLENIYSQAPYFMDNEDFVRIDSLLSPDFIRMQLTERRAELQFPMSAWAAKLCFMDPLGILPDLKPQLPASQFTSYDGYMMTTDEKIAFAFVDSPFGDSETKQNSLLVDNINKTIETMVASDFADLHIRTIGAPVIAVENARRIKMDSAVTICVALLLIVLLLFASLRDVRSMLLILATTGFGFLFALAFMGLFAERMSMIVIGIAAIIIGIAVNYPLHLIIHRQYTDTVKETMAEIVKPLVIGNITTVGAFLALIPLKAVALRHLGIFCALILIGTIIFTIVYLPHCRFETPRFDSYSRASKWLDYSSKHRLDKSRTVLIVLLVLTCVFGFCSRNVTFDSNFNRINYMTDEQKRDFAVLSALAGQDNGEIEVFVPCPESAQMRAERWNNFWKTRGRDVADNIDKIALELGFKPSAFMPFVSLITNPATDNVPDRGQMARREFMTEPEWHDFHESHPHAFTMTQLQSEMTEALSANFDYISLACSIIVFAFLWLSFKSFWFALIAFAPMAASWLWILGLMNILGIQFNIVNIILATFIFGQGDDYTIFITEGLIYEHKTGKEMLPRYKNEIILSALIMFIGIGVLIFAKHPAMFSLGAVVMIGMSSVVLMAYIVPPVLFRWFIRMGLIKN